MSSRYLLPCPECGKRVPVEAGRAGGTTTCSCGTTFDVPRVGILRTFPQEEVASSSQGKTAGASASNWGFRQGLILLGVLLLLAGGIPALYKTVTFPKSEFRTPEQIEDYANVQFDKMTLTESWGFWKAFIEPQGLTREPTPYEAAYEKQSANLRQWITIFSAVAIVGAILVIFGFFFVGGGKPKRN